MMCERCLCVCAACFLTLTLVLTSGFNLNWNYARVYSNHDPASYFGFSVEFLKQRDEYKLLVGAPRANDTKVIKHRNIAEPGVVYNCNLLNPESCDILVLDDKGNIQQSSPPVSHLKNHSWFGGMMAVQDEQQRIVVCSPRWKNSRHKNHYLMNGMCYWTDDSSHYENTKPLQPLVATGKQSTNKSQHEQIFNYAYGEAGFSVHFPKNSTEVLIGAPGVYDWKGAVIRYRVLSTPTFYGRVVRRSPFAQPEVSVPEKTPNLPDNAYLGYSLTSGRFTRTEGRHYYVSGAPRAAGYKGRVFMFDFPQNETDGLVVKRVLDGTQMGEYFGGSLCAADLNGDGLNDLIVGAPQYSLRSQNAADFIGDEGRIYVFINEDWWHFKETTEDTHIMGNRRYGARFGTAVANVGDLNYDNMEDIAVGAPYEENGVVYIFHGRKSGTYLEHVQTIHAKHIDLSIKGLGISFSKGTDIDNNKYNDIAVGAFESGHAVLLRGHPIVTLSAKLIPNIAKISNKTTYFNVKACLSYNGTFPPDSIETRYEIKVDSTYNRAHIIDGNTIVTARNYTQRLWKGDDSKCQTLAIQIKKEIRDPTKPVDIVMTYDLKDNPAYQKPINRPTISDGFCKECPVLDISQNKIRTKKVPFDTGCKTDVCKPDLTVEARFRGVSERLILGQHQSLEMVVDVLNKGEPAFLPQVIIMLPNKTSLIRVPPNCENAPDEDQSDKHVLLCDLGNSLEKNKTITLLMDLREIPIYLKELSFEVNATSSGEEATPTDNYRKLTLGLIVQADMTITGVSNREQIAYISQNGTIMKNLKVNHTFEVWNLGPSRVDNTTLRFKIPISVYQHESKIVMSIYRPEALLLNNHNTQPIDCEIEEYYKFAENSDELVTEPPIAGGNEPQETFPESDSSALSRSKRSTDERSKYLWITPQTPENKTLFLYCGTKDVECATVKCRAGPFQDTKSRAIITFPLELKNLDTIESLLEAKDIILLSSYGEVVMENPPPSVQPIDHQQDHVVVQTLFIGNVHLSDEGVPSWIIAVAIICGLLILFLIAMALHKMGFFRREDKEKLDALKEAEEED